jgi:hypothetical protein
MPRVHADPGFGIDPIIAQMADTVAAAAQAVNPLSQVIDVDWASLGNISNVLAAGDDVANYLAQQILVQGPALHNVEIIAYSRGAYLGEEVAKDLSTNVHVGRIQAIFLAPTGISPLGDTGMTPIEDGLGGKVHNITYNDGLNPFPSFAPIVVENYGLAGEDYIVSPLGYQTSDGQAAHEAFPAWYISSGQLERDIITFTGASPTTAAAILAASSSPTETGVEVYTAPGQAGAWIGLQAAAAFLETEAESLLDGVESLLGIYHATLTIQPELTLPDLPLPVVSTNPTAAEEATYLSLLQNYYQQMASAALANEAYRQAQAAGLGTPHHQIGEEVQALLEQDATYWGQQAYIYEDLDNQL